MSIIQQTQKLEEGKIKKLPSEPETGNNTQFPTKKAEPMSVNRFVFSSKVVWYWLMILLAVAAAIAIFVIPENALPLVYLRSSLAVIFIMFLPGFAFIKTLFPDKVPIKTSSASMDTLERIVLSLGMSLIITSILGLILNYTPWGVRLTSITLTLLALTAVLATVAVFREFKQDTTKIYV